MDSVVISAPKGIDVKELQSKLRVKKGDVFNIKKLRKDLKDIHDAPWR